MKHKAMMTGIGSAPTVVSHHKTLNQGLKFLSRHPGQIWDPNGTIHPCHPAYRVILPFLAGPFCLSFVPCFAAFARVFTHFPISLLRGIEALDEMTNYSLRVLMFK
jgi:hypothetical protein